MCGIWAIFGSDGDIGSYCKYAYKIMHRGPDAFRYETVFCFRDSCIAFHRLLIIGSISDMQPLSVPQYPYISIMCNGEIYNHKEIGKEFGFCYDTGSDAECIIHLYAKGGIEFAAKHLDGMFAFCLIDTAKRNVFIGRDTFGIKPIFRIATDTGFLALCSEAKGLVGLPYDQGHAKATSKIGPLLPGYVETYELNKNGKAQFTGRCKFDKIGDIPAYRSFPVTTGKDVKQNIRDFLTMAVKKRLRSGRRIGCFLSGGLDSSIVTALTVKLAKEIGIDYKIQTFTVGMEGSTDLAAARKVAGVLGTEHHEIVFTAEQSFEVVDKVIYHLESYDVCLVRSSVAMYLVSKYVKEKTDVKVLLAGEGADEIAQGYKYFVRAPSAGEASAESLRICNNMYMFAVQRCDRITTAWGLEMRVPFLDHRFSSYYLGLPDQLKMPKDGKEKYLLRSVFADHGLLPDEILWRTKLEFSEGISSVTIPWHKLIHSHLDKKIKDKELEDAGKVYPYNTPTSKEALHYRRLFEKYFPAMGKLVPDCWTPKWTKSSDDCSKDVQPNKQ